MFRIRGRFASNKIPKSAGCLPTNYFPYSLKHKLTRYEERAENKKKFNKTKLAEKWLAFLSPIQDAAVP